MTTPESSTPPAANPDPPAAGYVVPQWDRTTRLVVVIFLIIAAVYALTLIAPVMQLVIFSLLIAFLIHGPARALTRRLPISWPLAIVLLYILLILAILGSLLVVIPPVVSGVNTLVLEGVDAYENLKDTLRNYTPEMGVIDILGFRVDINSIAVPLRQFILGSELAAGPAEETAPADAETVDAVTGETLLEPISFDQLLDGISSVAGQVTGTVTSAITTVTGFFGALLLALFVSFLILLDWPRTREAAINWVAPGYRREFRLLAREIARVWNGFFRGQVTIGAIIGLVTWLQLMLMGIEGAEILALFTALISLIPTLGGFISLVPLSLVPLLRGSTVFVDMPYGLVALLVIGVNMVLTQVIWNVAAPLILGDALDLPLPVIIIGVLIGAAVGGVLGAFLVAPFMSTIRVIVDYLLHKIRAEDPFPPETLPPPHPV
ncbi:MAG: AI-2E family transporter [Anaerolineae bacterium]|nr:AI-2E family transporter [Anaerolineae bacterium]